VKVVGEMGVEVATVRVGGEMGLEVAAMVAGAALAAMKVPDQL
jgi:hypothetical protein